MKGLRVNNMGVSEINNDGKGLMHCANCGDNITFQVFEDYPFRYCSYGCQQCHEKKRKESSKNGSYVSVFDIAGTESKCGYCGKKGKITMFDNSNTPICKWCEDHWEQAQELKKNGGKKEGCGLFETGQETKKKAKTEKQYNIWGQEIEDEDTTVVNENNNISGSILDGFINFGGNVS